MAGDQTDSGRPCGLDADDLAAVSGLGFEPVSYLIGSATMAANRRLDVDVLHQETRIGYQGTRQRPVVAPWGSSVSSTAYTQAYPCHHRGALGHMPGFMSRMWATRNP